MNALQGRFRIDWPRAAIAAALLAGLFALLFFVLRPDSGDASIEPARRADTPAGPAGVSPGVHAGDLARDFEASDLDGNRFRLSDLRGAPVVINFWATWCTSCLGEMPALEEQRLEHESAGLQIVAVNVGEGEGDAREFIEALSLFEFSIAMDSDLTLSDMYSVRGMPHSVFIDADGVIRAEYIGPLQDETMEDFVQAAIEAVPGGDPPTTLRFAQTVPRENILEVEVDGREVRFFSPRLRCSEDYCATQALAGLSSAGGVRDVDLRSDASPAELHVTLEADDGDPQQVVDLVAEALRQLPDPLYTRDLELRYRD